MRHLVTDHGQFDAAGLSKRQVDAARTIANIAHKRDVPPEIAAAMIANAYGESRLGETMKGDGGHSIGLFQLHDQGVGRGLSVADRMDDRKNTERIIQELKKKPWTQPNAKPPSDDIRHPLTLYKEGVRDVSDLAAAFQVWVEHARYTERKEAERRVWARRLFPGASRPATPASSSESGGGGAFLLLLLGFATLLGIGAKRGRK